MSLVQLARRLKKTSASVKEIEERAAQNYHSTGLVIKNDDYIPLLALSVSPPNKSPLFPPLQHPSTHTCEEGIMEVSSKQNPASSTLSSPINQNTSGILMPEG
jgi:hypothetical protein